MSLISLSLVGIERDRTVTSARPSTPTTGFGQLVVAQIPSEAIVAYAALLAVFGVAGSAYRPGLWVLYGAMVALCPVVIITSYLANRTYGFVDPPAKKPRPVIVNQPLDIVSPATDDEVGAVADPKARTPLHLPILPATAGMLAMAVYGLTIPGSALQHTVSNVAFGILAGCLAVGGAVLMAIIAPYLGQPNSAVVADPTDVDG